MDVEDIARVAHELNAAYCRSLGDYSHSLWESTSPETKTLTVEGVEAVLVNRDWTPEKLHANWMRSKLDAGWVYGPVKDSIRKEHPNLVAFNQLSPDDQRKDLFFLTIVHLLGPYLHGK